MRKHTIGLDFGTNSVRAIVVDTADGKAKGSAVFNYPHGDMGVVIDPKDPHVARQHPADYVAGIEFTIAEALKQVRTHVGVSGFGIPTLCHDSCKIDGWTLESVDQLVDA